MTVVILFVFVFGYLAIAFEHALKINKAASALLIGVVCWTLYVLNLETLLSADLIPAWFASQSQAENATDVPLHFAIEGQHLHQTGEIASILFFLMGAMTIVELVDSHDSFALITDRIHTKSKRKLFWTIGLLTFFLSSVLDNLTTTIVMVSLSRKLIHEREDRLKFVGLVIIAANAGGAWTVIGDVTTTMLWIKHTIGTTEVMSRLFLGSLVCLLVPIIGLSYRMPGELGESTQSNRVRKDIHPWRQMVVLDPWVGGTIGSTDFQSLHALAAVHGHDVEPGSAMGRFRIGWAYSRRRNTVHHGSTGGAQTSRHVQHSILSRHFAGRRFTRCDGRFASDRDVA